MLEYTLILTLVSDRLVCYSSWHNNYVYHLIGAHLNDITFTVTDEVNVSFDLNCTSQGGPVNQMLWLHDDREVQNSSHFPILLDAGAGVYYSILAIDGPLLGKYSCMITNETNGTIGVKDYEVTGNMN